MTFNFYHSNLVRVNLALVLMDEQRRADLAQIVRSSNLTAAHRVWAEAHAERRRTAAQASDPGEIA